MKAAGTASLVNFSILNSTRGHTNLVALFVEEVSVYRPSRSVPGFGLRPLLQGEGHKVSQLDHRVAWLTALYPISITFVVWRHPDASCRSLACDRTTCRY